MVNKTFWQDRHVFITGHTGFKGGWLSLWLQHLGARVYGLALEPLSEPNLFYAARVEEEMQASTIADIRSIEHIEAALRKAAPEVVFHLAAQPLVRESYIDPVKTYATNVMGTVNLLQAVRGSSSVRAVLNVTTDKCYENLESARGYTEDDRLGGYDPYSSSKACSELVTAAYRQSFLSLEGVAVATARAGNVIGGGDWSADRLLPDIFRAITAGEELLIRAPEAVRPWQHVLEPLCGYLMLAERLCSEGDNYSAPWNFGPADADACPVGWIVERVAAMHDRFSWRCDQTTQPHETSFLKLDSSKARRDLGWRPQLDLEQALVKTVEWHAAWQKGADMRAYTLNQIMEYSNGIGRE